MHRLYHHLQDLTSGLHDLLFPPVCLHCEQLIEAETPLPGFCPACLAALETLPETHTRTEILARLDPCFIDDLRAAFGFEEVMRSVLHHIKYQQMPGLALAAGQYAAAALPDLADAYSDALVLPVPIHPVRRKERAYNQSALIARGLFQHPPEPIDERLLCRRRHTPTQTHLNRVQRQFNVKEAFEVTIPSRIKGRRVVLVDDVVTTGATLNECAWLLKSHEAVEVTALALATPLDITAEFGLRNDTNSEFGLRSAE